MRKLSLTALAFAASLPATALADDAGLAARLHSVIESAVAQERIVGAVVLVARDGAAGMVGTAGDILSFLEAIRTGGSPILGSASAQALTRNAIGTLPVMAGPGWGFSFGAAVLLDPKAAGTPQSAGTWAWGGVYGHHWFVDPERRLSVVVLTNTAVAGMAGPFPEAVRDAIYGTRDRVSGAE